MVLDHSTILPGTYPCLLSTSNELNVNSWFFYFSQNRYSALTRKGIFHWVMGAGDYGWRGERIKERWRETSVIKASINLTPLLLNKMSKTFLLCSNKHKYSNRRNSRTVFKVEYQENEGSEGRMREQRGGRKKRREIRKRNKRGKWRWEIS